MRQTINGADFRRMLISAAASIEIHKQQLNELNVFPVPDGDTGTNMSMTINAAAADLRKTEDPSLEKASQVTASAMLRGARGNSGVILSLLFRGLSKKLKGTEIADGVLWAEALQEGVDAAYKAVMKPAEGTILTVARLAAAAARTAAQENNFLEAVHVAALEEAKVALANTTNQNPVLKKAGVVDAGGRGWVCALEGMLSSLQGSSPQNTVAMVSALKLLGDATHQQGQNNTGVATSTTEHGGCCCAGSLLQGRIFQLAQIGCCGVDGHGHVGASVAIGNGEHVQLVQSLFVNFNTGSRTDHQSAKIGAIYSLLQLLSTSVNQPITMEST